MSTTGHTQAPRTAWINAMRSEVLRVGKRIPEVARVVHVGVWIATYADADGGNAFPGRDTLACLAGCSQESVTRCVKVLIGVGALKRRRRPNASSVYELVPEVFLPGGLPWEEHMHHYTDTRQRKAHAKKKAEEAAEAAEAARIASMDAIREDPDGVHGRRPDSVHDGGSGSRKTGPDRVHGRPRKASVDAVRTASTAGVYKDSSTSGRDPHRDKDGAGHSPQPPKRARADEPTARHCPCGGRILLPDRDRCGACLRYEARAADEQRKAHQKPQKPFQGAFLLPLPGGGQAPHGGRRERVQWPVEDPAAPLRMCGCGREYRLPDCNCCPACLVAAEQERRDLGSVSGG